MATMEHIIFLAREIGPRGSTTAEEKKAARYAAKVLAGLGLEPDVGSFSSAKIVAVSSAQPIKTF